MIGICIVILLIALIYYIINYFINYFIDDKCSSGTCGGCSKCSCKSGTCGHCKQCKIEDFRFLQENTNGYLKTTNVQDVNPLGQASVSIVNTGIPFYFDAYGTELSMGPGQGDPGVVAPFAQYNDLYKSAQNLHKDFPNFNITSYTQGGAISDLYLAEEEHNKLQEELNHH
jgi:hypothetical protein